MVSDILPATGSPVAVMGYNSKCKLALKQSSLTEPKRNPRKSSKHEEFCIKIQVKSLS
jgi:hypothetical protein